jgi:Spy/CpxP family protein refolding chaperone
MKKLALAVALSFALPSFAFAAAAPDATNKVGARVEQSDPAPQGKVDHRGHHDGQRGRGGEFGGGLELTKEQSEAARKTFKAGHFEQFEITKKYIQKLSKADQEALREELQQAQKKQQEEFLKLLTPEQKAKAEAFHAELRDHDKHKKQEDEKPAVAK